MTSVDLAKIGLQTVTLRAFTAAQNLRTEPTALDIARQELLFGVRYKGELFGDGHLQIENDDRFSRRWDKAYGEALDLTRLLLAMDLRPVEVIPCDVPEPDTLVRFDDGSEQRIEVGRIVDQGSAKRSGILHFLKVGITQACVSNRSLRTAVMGCSIHITLARLPRNSAEKRSLLKELEKSFIRKPPAQTSTLRPYVFQSDCAALRACGSTCVSVFNGFTWIQIDQPFHVARPAIAAAAFKRMIQEKQGKTYAAGTSIWLALVFDDVEQREADALDAIRPLLRGIQLGQFDRIVVGYERGFAEVARPSADAADAP